MDKMASPPMMLRSGTRQLCRQILDQGGKKFYILCRLSDLYLSDVTNCRRNCQLDLSRVLFQKEQKKNYLDNVDQVLMQGTLTEGREY
jgi:hypothetical protein